MISYLLEIVDRVRRMENPPFRPYVPMVIEKAEQLKTLMKRCWNENDDDRPTFHEIKKDIEILMKRNGR